MPIHLPPISRRRFLVRSLAAGAGLVLSPKLFAAGKRADPNLWALLSDTHIATDRTQIVRGANMTEHLAGVSGELIALPERPAGVFILGDCAYDSGEKGDYATLTNLLEPLRQAQMPIHLALGNHDNRERFWAALREAKSVERGVADRQVALLRTPRANWFILDSLDRTLSTPGVLGAEQFDWLAKSLDANQRKPALVLIHHQPDERPNPEGLKDTEALFKVIRPRKQVKAYLFGHTHDWNVRQDDSGIHLINLPPVAYVFTPGKPSGWVQARLEPDAMRLELRCVDKTHKAHGQVFNLKWRAA